jgi:hypothetical protein
MVISDEFDLHVAESLVTEFGCKARDAILVATAIKNGCPKFITRDDRLKRQLRRFKAIPIVSVQSVLDELGVRAFYSSSSEVGSRRRVADNEANDKVSSPLRSSSVSRHWTGDFLSLILG